MRPWLLPVALGLAAALLGLGVALAARDAGTSTPQAREAALAAELRCPDCQGLSVADSPTRSAREIRARIGELIAGGSTDEDVRAHFVARYGEWVLLAPSAPALWVIPFVVVAGGAVALGAWLVIRRRPPADAGLPVPTPEERRRVHDEAETLDA